MSRFQEIEHKFVVDDDYDRARFIAAVMQLNPLNSSRVSVNDTYYVLRTSARHIYRHRLDAEIQQLTVKSLEDDSEFRTEINLDLGLHAGDQTERVQAFLATFGIQWQGIISKEVYAFYFENCEIVLYEARFEGRHLVCVEFEATGIDDPKRALAVLDQFEQKLGFNSADRTKESLFHLLIYPTLSSHIR